MTAAEILAVLAPWQTAMRECERRLSEALVLFGGECEAPLPGAVCACMEAYTKLVAEHIGWDASALTDWWLSNDFGEYPMQIGFVGEPMRSIDNIEALAEFIAEGLQRPAA